MSTHSGATSALAGWSPSPCNTWSALRHQVETEHSMPMDTSRSLHPGYAFVQLSAILPHSSEESSHLSYSMSKMLVMTGMERKHLSDGLVPIMIWAFVVVDVPVPGAVVIVSPVPTKNVRSSNW